MNRLPSQKVAVLPSRTPAPRSEARIAPAISNVAAVLIQAGTGKFRLRDLTDGNLLVNGRMIDAPEVEIADGDAVDFGDYVFEFKARRAPAVAPMTEHGIKLGTMRAWSPAMVRVFQRIHRITNVDMPVLITGASGSGKELAARALHDTSERADAPFLALNCGALSANLIESELFGPVKGAFTGAPGARAGAFEACDGGTLFLDEIGELPLDLQPKLLRVLETMTVRRIGGTKETPINTRIVAATHRDLEAMVAAGTFREDLYHRLTVLTVELPSLAERREDIVPLARFFLAMASEPLRLTRDAEAKLQGYSWPGNVRELRNVITRARVLADGDAIEAHDLELKAARRTSSQPILREVSSSYGQEPAREASASYAEVSPLSINQDDQRERFIALLRDCNNNRAEAARRLGIAKSTFHAQLRRAGIGLKFDR